MYESYGLLIGGRWRQAADAATLAVFDPAIEEEIGVIPGGTFGIREYLEAKTVKTVI